MSEQAATHGSFTIERLIDAPVAQVYAAFSTAAGKARWFAAPDGEVIEREFEFRTGGRDRLRCQWRDGHVTDFRAQYWDIVPERRIVYTYEMNLDATRISVSLATVQFQALGARTRLSVTEQGVFLNGYRDDGARERGTNALMDAMVGSLGAAAQSLYSREITFTRMLHAPRELVFLMWTEAEHLARWFAPQGFTVSRCRVDARVGGKWELLMRANDDIAALVGREHPAAGEFKEVDPPSRLVFTNNAFDADGRMILEGLTTVTFEAHDGWTRMLMHTRAAGAGDAVTFMLDGMQQGWSESLEKLRVTLNAG